MDCVLTYLKHPVKEYQIHVNIIIHLNIIWSLKKNCHSLHFQETANSFSVFEFIKTVLYLLITWLQLNLSTIVSNDGQWPSMLTYIELPLLMNSKFQGVTSSMKHGKWTLRWFHWVKSPGLISKKAGVYHLALIREEGVHWAEEKTILSIPLGPLMLSKTQYTLP